MGISRQQALECFRSDDLVGIGMEADAVRRRLHPEGVVSYLMEHIVHCAALTGRAQEELWQEIDSAVDAGCGAIRLEGLQAVDGPAIAKFVSELRQRFPSLWIEALSVSDVLAIAAVANADLREALGSLGAAGLNSITGEGSPLATQDWINVHRAAHTVAMQTTARAVFGGGETTEQRIDFLEAVQLLQDETGGLTSFAATSAPPPNGRELDGMTAVERLKTLAIARMYLDTIPNVQAMHAGQGLKVLEMGLRFGSNDLGSLDPRSGDCVDQEEDLRRIIRDAGFQPAQRDAAYRMMFLN
jgi:cyclic dehypoxanthinyl futalosine synthase